MGWAYPLVKPGHARGAKGWREGRGHGHYAPSYAQAEHRDRCARPQAVAARSLWRIGLWSGLEQRRRAGSNRRMEVLQTSALPLGYGAGCGVSCHRTWATAREPGLGGGPRPGLLVDPLRDPDRGADGFRGSFSRPELHTIDPEPLERADHPGELLLLARLTANLLRPAAELLPHVRQLGEPLAKLAREVVEERHRRGLHHPLCGLAVRSGRSFRYTEPCAGDREDEAPDRSRQQTEPVLPGTGELPGVFAAVHP